MPSLSLSLSLSLLLTSCFCFSKRNSHLLSKLSSWIWYYHHQEKFWVGFILLSGLRLPLWSHPHLWGVTYLSWTVPSLADNWNWREEGAGSKKGRGCLAENQRRHRLVCLARSGHSANNNKASPKDEASEDVKSPLGGRPQTRVSCAQSYIHIHFSTLAEYLRKQLWRRKTGVLSLKKWVGESCLEVAPSSWAIHQQARTSSYRASPCAVCWAQGRGGEETVDDLSAALQSKRSQVTAANQGLIEKERAPHRDSSNSWNITFVTFFLPVITY